MFHRTISRTDLVKLVQSFLLRSNNNSAAKIVTTVSVSEANNESE